MIVLPAEEKVANVFAGDTVDWVFDGGHVASRFISVKPKTANGSTDIHIVSDHGNEYTLELREVSADDDTHYDSKVLIEPGDKAAKDRLTQLPVFVPAADLDKAKQDAAAAQAAQAATLKAEQSKEETYRSQYPGSLHFDYVWDEKKGKELGLQQIWRDDKFTYLRGQFQETPALYEVKDKNHRSSTSTSPMASIPCRRNSTTVISPSVNSAWTSIAPGGEVIMSEPNEQNSRHRARTARIEAAAAEEYAGRDRPCRHRRSDRDCKPI